MPKPPTRMFTGAGAGAGATGSGGSALFCCGAWIRLVGASSPVEGVDDTHRRNIWKVNKAMEGAISQALKVNTIWNQQAFPNLLWHLSE